MGTYNEFIRGRGKDKKEALKNAWDEYVWENGHRCDLRDVKAATKIKDVPPIKPKVEVKEYRDFNGRKRTQEVHSAAEDPQAPRSEWQEEWQFEVWVHS